MFVFQKVVWMNTLNVSCFRSFSVSCLNPHDRDEIIFDLKIKREISQNRLRLERQRKELDDDLKAIQKDSKAYKNRLDKYQAIASLLAEEEECQKRGKALSGLEDAEPTRVRLLGQINVMTNRLRELNSEEKQLLGEINEFKKQYQCVFDNESKIEDVIHDYRKLKKDLVQANQNEKDSIEVVISNWKSISSEPWNDMLGAHISRLDLIQLNSLLEHCQKLREQKKQIQEDIENLRASKLKTKRSSNFVAPLIIFIKNRYFASSRKNLSSPQTNSRRCKRLTRKRCIKAIRSTRRLRLY